MRPVHITVEESFYFLTTHCARGARPFLNPSAANAFLKILEKKQRSFGFRLFAYVVMPNHTHLLLRLPVKTTISKLMNHINGASAHEVNSALGKSHEQIWQGGFHDVVIRSAAEFAMKVNYTHENPVKWGLVEKAEEYGFSSAQFYMKNFDSPYLETDGFDDFGLMGLLNSVESVTILVD